MIQEQLWLVVQPSDFGYTRLSIDSSHMSIRNSLHSSQQVKTSLIRKICGLALSALFIIMIIQDHKGISSSYSTVRSGNWDQSSTWSGGSIPPEEVDGDHVSINHDVSIPNGMSDIKIKGKGSITITGATLSSDGKNLIIEDGLLSGTNSHLEFDESGIQLSQSNSILRLSNGSISSDQNFQNSEGKRVLNHVCLTVGESFQNSGGTDSLIHVCAYVGSEGSGNVQNTSSGTMHTQQSEFRLNSGDFQNESGCTLTGDMDAVWVESGNFENNGKWTAAVSAYCVSSSVSVPGAYLPSSESCGSINSYFPCDCSGALPVEWTGFRVQQVNGLIRLEWQTAFEINNDYFEVERSSDGLMFTALGQIMGAGNSNSTQHYSFLDHEQSLQNQSLFYRIKQVDVNGSFSYSPIKQIQVSGSHPRIDLSLYPNPVNRAQLLTIDLNHAFSTAPTLNIVNLQGQNMYSDKLEERFSGSIQLSVAQWPTGLYILDIQAEGIQESAMFLVQ